MTKKLMGATLASLLLAGSASAVELTYSTHLPPSIAVNSAGIEPAFDAIAAATNDEVTFKYFWAGQLYDAAGAFEAIRDGAIDIGFTQPEDKQSDMPANLLFSDLYFKGGNPYVTAAAANETVLLNCEDCLAEYTNNNAMFMGTHAATPTVMVCAKPVETMADLQGSKVIGQTTIAGWVQTFNGTQIDVPPPARLEALERGVADCTLMSAEWLTAFSINEVAETVVTTGTGSQFALSIATMNATTWDGLPEEIQAEFLRAMPNAIAGIVDAYTTRDAEAIEEAKAMGITFTDLGGTYEEALETYLGGYEENVIEEAEARGVENAAEIVNAFLANLEKWDALIAENGTENYSELLWNEIYSKVDY